MENKKQKRKEFVIKIGPLLYEILTKLKTKINDFAYNSLIISDYEAGEILAKKVNEKKLL